MIKKNKISEQWNFQHVVSIIDQIICDNLRNDNEKIETLKDYVRIIQLDIQYQNISKYIYTKDTSNIVYIPLDYTKNGEVYKISSIGTKEINFSDECIFTSINKPGKLLEISKNMPFIQKGFDEERRAEFYTGINICRIVEGKHHAVKDILYSRQGKVTAEVINTEELYGNVYTDGAYWYNMDGSINSKVKDFRIATLFYITEKLYRLEH